jgi:hypothetical protein
LLKGLILICSLKAAAKGSMSERSWPDRFRRFIIQGYR